VTGRETTLQRSPLHDVHVAGGGRLVPFAGWELPIQYEGVIAEHRAVRSSAGLFDVSHMGQLLVRGSSAFADLQRLLTNDVGRCRERGVAQYTLLANESGGVEDDLICYRLDDEDTWVLVVNASRVEHDHAWLAERIGPDTELLDVSDQWAMLALQGPLALDVLAEHVVDIRDLPRFRHAAGDWHGAYMRIATTGYTGEPGCEIMIQTGGAVDLWETLLGDDRVTPAGLGARDTLRLEACYPLYGNDLTTETSVVGAGLGWACGWGTGFIGEPALQREREAGSDRVLVPLRATERGIPGAGCDVLDGDQVVGTVTSGTHSPSLDVGIALAWVEADHTQVGSNVAVDVRGRQLSAEVVSRPFLQAPSKD
jgi:aminomethyltransferase